VMRIKKPGRNDTDRGRGDAARSYSMTRARTRLSSTSLF
jgi:hypothetical protein